MLIGWWYELNEFKNDKKDESTSLQRTWLCKACIILSNCLSLQSDHHSFAFFFSLSCHLTSSSKDIIQHYIQGNRLSSSIFTSYCTMLCIYIKKVTLCKFFLIEHEHICIYTVRVESKNALTHTWVARTLRWSYAYMNVYSLCFSHSNWTGHYPSICIMGKMCDHWYV